MAQNGPVALTNTNLFDGVNNEIKADATVFIRDGLVERITTGDVDISDEYEVIDTEGNYLMPDMFDVHTHIDSIKRARQAIESGVTTARSSSVTSFQDVALRELVRNGKIIGPEFAAAGIYITPNTDCRYRFMHTAMKVPAPRCSQVRAVSSTAPTSVWSSA